MTSGKKFSIFLDLSFPNLEMKLIVPILFVKHLRIT